MPHRPGTPAYRCSTWEGYQTHSEYLPSHNTTHTCPPLHIHFDRHPYVTLVILMILFYIYIYCMFDNEIIHNTWKKKKEELKQNDTKGVHKMTNTVRRSLKSMSNWIYEICSSSKEGNDRKCLRTTALGEISKGKLTLNYSEWSLLAFVSHRWMTL